MSIFYKDLPRGGRVTNSARRGLAIALLGFFLLACGDIVVKSIAASWPGSAIAALRYTAGALGLALLVAIRCGRAGFAIPKPWLQLGRGVAVGVATATFFLSLRFMPLADATAIFFTAPIWTVILSFLLLREPPAPAVSASIALASVGVILVLRPNVLAFGAEALLPLTAALAMACLFLLNRRAAGLAPIIVLQFLAAAMALPILYCMALAGHLVGDPAMTVSWPSSNVLLGSLVVAISATCGHLCIFRATELASAATIAPMTYIQLLVALGADMFVFGDFPAWATLIGAGLIISGGLIVWHGQRRS